MANMSLKKNPMPSQEPDVRNKNFDEVALGYTEEMAIDEAKRCLNCKNPKCVEGCPVNVRIPEFISKVVEGDFKAAYEVITSTNALPALSGRVCPQETQCESRCVRGIKGEPVAIGRLERFVADWYRENINAMPQKAEPNGKKVAVVGSGPAGLTCASDLAKKGYEVSLFEALHTAGGVLVYGIPEFRLPKSIVQKEVDGLKAMGVKVETNTVVGRTITIDELMEENGFEAVFVGSGAGLPRFMNIPGESLKGVYSANEFLTRSNLMKAYLPTSKTPIRTGKKVAVVGGGNVAMDAARSALRLGAESVYIVYRRGMAELPARKEEVEHAEEEGIIFKTLCNPIAIHPDEDGFVHSMTCIEMELGEPDASGRRRPIEKQGSEFELEVDTVIMSLGTSPNPLIRSTTPGLDADKHGCLITNGPDGLTSRPMVYAGGDAMRGPATVVEGIADAQYFANAVIGDGVALHPHATVCENAVIGENSILYPNVTVYHDCRVGKRCILHAGSVVGADGFGFAPSPEGYEKIPQIGIAMLEDDVEIGANTCVDRATMGATIVHKGVKLDNLIQIAHNVEVGSHTVMASQVGIAGSTKVGEWCMFGGQVGLAGHIRVGNHVNIGAQSGIPGTVKGDNLTIMGSPAIDAKQFFKSSVIYKKLPDMYQTLNRMEKEIEELKKQLNK